MANAPRIEHLNVTVRDPEGAAKLFQELFGWEVRWDGPTSGGGRTIHVGSSDSYVALCTGPAGPLTAELAPKGRPFNHVGVEVSDLDATEALVAAAGLKTFAHDDYEPGRRFYFRDPNGIEFEVVSYGARGDA
ncbi:MAG TPA: VOC family protein [Allosphingosinicella sp.]|nr:VOC family protein [Allosphingosinicella sp.]